MYTENKTDTALLFTNPIYLLIIFKNYIIFNIYNNFHVYTIYIYICRCSVTISPCSSSVCQLKVSFLDLSLAPPNGDGICVNDRISITGGANPVPNICGENSGQHMYIDFDGSNPISVSVSALSAYTFGRHWNIKIAQINCDDRNRGKK